jgi:hypothetical protein
VSLGKKVSKERILQELQLMLSHVNAPGAANMLHKLRLLQVLIELPSLDEVRCKIENVPAFSDLKVLDEESKIRLSNEKFHAYGMAALLLYSRSRTRSSVAAANHMAIRMAILSAASAGYAVRSRKKNSLRCMELAEFLLVNSLKMRNKDVELVLQLHHASRVISHLLRRLVVAGVWSKATSSVSYNGFDEVAAYGGLNRIELGECVINGGNYTHEAIDLAFSLLQLEILQNGDLSGTAAAGGKDIEAIVAALHQEAEGAAKTTDFRIHPNILLLKEARVTMLEAIETLQLQECWQQQPLINGTALKAILTNIPLGTAFGLIMEHQSRWMLAHPAGTAASLERDLKLKYQEYV